MPNSASLRPVPSRRRTRTVIRTSIRTAIRVAVGAIALGSGLLTACAPYHAPLDAGSLNTMLAPRTGVVGAVVWGADTAALADSVAALLRRPLSPDVAVRVTLLSNPTLLALYEEVGLARSDVLQAGLLSNPLVSVDRFTGGRFEEFGVVQSFVDLLQRPLRKRVAAAQLEAVSLQVADAVFRALTDSRAALADATAAEQIRDLRRRARQSAAAAAVAAEQVHHAGNLLDLDLASEQARAAERHAEAIQAEGAALAARERLARALGVMVAGDSLRLPARLIDTLQAIPTQDSLVALAVASRLDLAAALKDINARALEAGFTARFRYLADGSLSYSGESGGERSRSGLGLSLPIPLFDRGQARMQRAESQLRQSMARHQVLLRTVRSEVREALALLSAAERRVSAYRTSIVPLRQRVTQETQLLYNAMAVGVFGLLDSQQSELAAGQSYIEALRDYWTARYQLERALGTRLP